MRPAPELIIGLVGAVGTPMDVVGDELERSLSRVAYGCVSVRLSELPESVALFRSKIDKSTEYQRIKTSMRAGTEFRGALKRGDALACLAVTQIPVERKKAGGKPEQRAYVLRQLKRPQEVEALRDVYRDHFLLLGVYMPRALRAQRLAERLARSEGGKLEDYRAKAEDLIGIDESERGTTLGQDVRGTFPLADVFLDAADPLRLAKETDRFIDILFGRPCMTPTREECGMAHAQAAALRSAALGRQVGAALTTQEGDLLGVGMNEVPRGGGGHYWEGDEDDGREFTRGFDQNDVLKASVLREVLVRLQGGHCLVETLSKKLPEELLAEVRELNLLKDARILDLTEFGREVHAEMSAILTAARRGVSTAGCTLYTTTFPCHNCAKHIVGAGITRVVYVEPYAKSFAAEFHPDSIEVEADEAHPNKALFEPFVGVSPRKYFEWFKAEKRKDDDGKVVRWHPTEQAPIFAKRGGVDLAYIERENENNSVTANRLREAGLITA